ncbi:molecular chaperone [Pantoea sp. KPR_PJ]|uniref:fimbrial biogenesis chaperone n=1 Tax=Pantoea sp. KPR_PJ TaxID=2738375 RepID=UPI00352778FB
MKVFIFKKIRTLVLLSASLLSITAQAGIVMGGTRVVFQEGKKEATLTVTNQDKDTPYLVQSWIENFDNSQAPVPFIITPPLFRLDAEKENILRINYNGLPLPKDRESVFWLNVKSIAPSSRDQSNELQINIKSKFKLFYRPKGLTGSATDAWQKLTFHREGNQLIGHNPTPYFISFYKLSVGGHEIQQPGMIGPGEDKRWTTTGAGSVTWSAINDFGGTTPEQTR